MPDSKICVLLVEDNEPDIKLTLRLLRNAPNREFVVTTVNRLQNALDNLRSQKYDIILLDLGLPDSKGIATFNAIKSECPDLPVVIFTIVGNEASGAEAIRRGAQDYLVKGTSDERILEKSISYAIERKRLEVDQRSTHEKLRESEERFRNIFSNAAMGMVEYDTTHHFLAVNDQACRVLGYTREELLGKRVLEITAPEDQEITLKNNEMIHNGQADRFVYEKRYVHHDGSYIWARVTLSAIRDHEDRHVLTVGTIEDITERKKTEIEIRRSEERFRTVFDSNMLAIAFWRTDGFLIEANKAFCDLIGVTPEEVRSEKVRWVDFTPTEILWRDKQGIDEINTTGVCKPYEKKFIHRDGHTVPILIGGASVTGEKDQGVAFAVDLTIQKETEKALRESEERFRIMADGVPMIIWVTNKDGGIQFVNKTYVDFFGTSLEQVEGGNWQPLVHPDDAAGYTQEYLRSVREHQPFRAEGRVRRADGQWRWVVSYGEPRYSLDGKFLGHVGLSPDITELKQAEEALRKSEERFRGLVLASSDVLYRMSPDWSEMIQLNSEGFLNETLEPNPLWRQEYIHPDDQSRVNEAIKDAIRTKSVFELEHHVIRADGTLGWTFSRAVPLMDKNGEITEWFGAASDITARKQAELALQESEKKLKILNENLENIIVQRTEQVRSLSAALTFAEQRERKRFSYVLHEGLQQKLLGARILLNQHTADHQAKKDESGLEDLDDGLALLNNAIQITRTLSLELNPPILNTEGLDTALRWLCTHMQNNYKLNVDLQLHGSVDHIRGEPQMLLTNMIRELLYNVVKHSGVFNAYVNVTCEHRQIKVIVEDKGKGFNVEEIAGKKPEETKFGLFSVKERLGLFGGQLNIESQIGRGTKCTILYPHAEC